jgi:Methyltransferase domain
MNTKEFVFKAFRVFERAGIHILPRHYYTPIPDSTWLDQNRSLWMGRSSLTGIGWDLPEQLAWLKETCTPYYPEVAGLSYYRALAQKASGPGYADIESQVLHCVMRRFAPAQVLEIGSGASTLCMLEASKLNQRDGKTPTKITCVEPYPSENLRRLSEIKLIPQFCQEVPLSVIDQLGKGDLLFIDSSHAVRVGSDVMRIYLEMIPRLPAGVLIQIHDIYLPYAYPRTVFTRPFWWMETALLMALLINNPKIRVLGCLSALHYDYPQEMRQVLSDYTPAPNDEGLPPGKTEGGHFPSSVYLQTV